LTTESTPQEKIDSYLRESGLGGAHARVVPLTGDASDRKYFRIIPANGPSIVLALHADAIDFSTLRLRMSAGCWIRSRFRCRRFSATPMCSGS